ncbi:MAG: hypothetical protein ACYC91_03215 [Solirubrobacteraceae bacterium]
MPKRDVPELIAALEHLISGYDERAQPLVWTKRAEPILDKAVKRQVTTDMLR